MSATTPPPTSSPAGGWRISKRRLGELARERDVTNWEENTATYEGIGRGLGKAQASPVEVQTYTTNLAGSDPKKAEAIQKGYEAERS